MKGPKRKVDPFIAAIDRALAELPSTALDRNAVAVLPVDPALEAL
jgi:hypothetical protein